MYFEMLNKSSIFIKKLSVIKSNGRSLKYFIGNFEKNYANYKEFLS